MHTDHKRGMNMHSRFVIKLISLVRLTSIYCFLLLAVLNGVSWGEVNDCIVRITSSEEVLELSCRWYFKAEDNPVFREIDADLRGWDLIYNNKSWTYIQKYKQYKGIAWYRLNLDIDIETSDLALLIPIHYRGAQFYLNGILFHETRHFTPQGETPAIVGKPELVNIPCNIIKRGSNALAIRIGFLDSYGGFFRNIQIGTCSKMHTKWVCFILFYSALAAINIFLTLYFLLLFWNRREERYYLYFSGLAFSLGIWILGYKGLALWILDNQWFYIICTYIGAIFAPFMTINFLRSFFEQTSTWFTRFFNFFFSLLAVLLLFELLLTGSIYYFQKYLFAPFILSNILVIIYGVTLCILGVKGKRNYSKRILLGTSILGISSLISMFNFLGIFSIEPPLIEGFFGMTVIFASVLASRFARVHTELEKTYSELQEINRIKDNTVNRLNIFKHIVSSSGDQISFINKDYIVIAANNALLKAIKREEDQIIGQSIEKVYGEKGFTNVIKDYCDRCLSGEEIHFEEWCNYFGDGRKYIVNKMYPHINENEEIVGIIMNSRDITENVKLEMSIIDIGQEERRQIGIELHDGLSHDLLVIAIKSKLLAESLKDESMVKAASAYEIEELINKAIAYTRSLARGISPVTLDRGSLIMLFDMIKEDIEDKYGISLMIDVDKSIEFDDIMIPTHLYYITREAVNNAVRHSKAKHIKIRFFTEDEHIHLIIEDDGIGITGKLIKEKGIGLDIMKYRARMLGGTLDIQSAKNNGTRVICRV
jgi:PAS domain S-box-containing protein